MFGKNDYQKAMAELNAAEQRLTEIRKSSLTLKAKLEEAERHVAEDESSHCGVVDADGRVISAELLTKAAEAQATRRALRDQMKRYVEAVDKEIEAAELTVLRAELGVIEAQRSAFEFSYQASLQRLWEAIEKPLRDCVVHGGASAYCEAQLRHRRAYGSAGGALVARQDWNSVAPVGIVELALASLVREKQKDGFCMDIAFGGDIKGLPPMQSPDSALVDQNRRSELFAKHRLG